jgi:hypothetical protein
MKFPIPPTLILATLLLTGCETLSEPKIGMEEKKWVRNAVLADEVYKEGGVSAYRSNRLYYYFQDGILVKIDPARIPAQKFKDQNKAPQMSAAPADVYGELKKLDELRKDGIITDEEFQVQKKKILERGN